MDNLGNRTGNQTLRSDGTVNFAVQSSTNRYTSIGGNSISHDDAGNLAVDKDGYKYSYDYENRVVKIQKPDGLGGWDDVAEMAYDALGRRIRVIDSIGSAATLYYYNPEWQCLAEYNGAGALQRYFVYGNYIDEPLVMHSQSDGEDYYYGQDHLYSTVVLLDDGGNVVERYEYDAYGTVLVYTDDGNDDTWFTGDDTTATASAKGNPYTFTGRRLDALDPNGQSIPQLLRMHYRHRDYDAYAGRFTRHDPLGPVAGINLYAYVLQKPTHYSDPLGLQSYTPWPMPGYSPFPGQPPFPSPPSKDDNWGKPDPHWMVWCGDVLPGTKCKKALDKCDRDHCDLRNVPVEKERTNTRCYPVWLDSSDDREMYAPGTPGHGKKCSQVTESDRIWCSAYYQDPKFPDGSDNPNYSYKVWGNNCHTHLARALSGCCFKSKYDLPYSSGQTTAPCLEYDTVPEWIPWPAPGYYVMKKKCVKWGPKYNE